MKKRPRKKKSVKKEVVEWIEDGCLIVSACGKIPQQEFLKQISKPK